MANEASVRTNLSIRKTNSDGSIVLIDYTSRPSGFNADVTGTKGPCVGAIAVTTSGTDVDLSQLTTPGFMRITNEDATNYFEVGIRDPATRVFYPMLEVLPGESYVMRLSRNVGEEDYPSTGTGTTASIAKLHLKSHAAATIALVEVFES